MKYDQILKQVSMPYMFVEFLKHLKHLGYDMWYAMEKPWKYEDEWYEFLKVWEADELDAMDAQQEEAEERLNDYRYESEDIVSVEYEQKWTRGEEDENGGCVDELTFHPKS